MSSRHNLVSLNKSMFSGVISDDGFLYSLRSSLRCLVRTCTFGNQCAFLQNYIIELHAFLHTFSNEFCTPFTLFQRMSSFTFSKEVIVNMKNQKATAIIRLIVQAILLVNMGLTLAGKNPIPFDEATVTEWLTVAAAGISSIWTWWKNNNVTKKAQEAQTILKGLKEDGDGSDFVVDGEIEGVDFDDNSEVM